MYSPYQGILIKICVSRIYAHVDITIDGSSCSYDIAYCIWVWVEIGVGEVSQVMMVESEFEW